MATSQPVPSQAADPIAQFLSSCRRLGRSSCARMTTATISAMTGMNRLSSTAAIVSAPLNGQSSPAGPASGPAAARRRRRQGPGRSECPQPGRTPHQLAHRGPAGGRSGRNSPARRHKASRNRRSTRPDPAAPGPGRLRSCRAGRWPASRRVIRNRRCLASLPSPASHWTRLRKATIAASANRNRASPPSHSRHPPGRMHHPLVPRSR
jgi:hypothetical protein